MTIALEASSTITSRDPRDGSDVGSIPTTSMDELREALRASRAAARTWARTDAAVRGTALRSVAAAIKRADRTLAELQERETGRAFEEALGGVHAGVATLLQYAEIGPLRQTPALNGAALAADYSRSVPRGVVAVITPWNDPVAIACGLIGAALVTGSTVIFKPSEHCSLQGELLGRLFEEHLPESVLRTVIGDGALGAALSASTGVDAIAHVGSTATGRRIARAAALTGAHVIRENGGNDPLIVDAGVDPDWAAAQAVLGGLTNAGQLCTSVERVYVHRDIAKPFLRHLVRRAEAQPIGPLIDGALRDRVHADVTEAVASGAELLLGGVASSGEGSHYPATVLVGCTDQMAVMREETFGPVLPVTVVDDREEALRLAAAGEYGLSATVLTHDLGFAHDAIATLPVGTVKVNAVFGGAPGGSAQPRGASGAGFGYGPSLLDEMRVQQVVHVEAAPRTPAP